MNQVNATKPAHRDFNTNRRKEEDMNYARLSNEELKKCKFPNLMAEIIESGYSTSTLADFMGLGSKKDGKYRAEGDPEVWDKITGKEELYVSHAKGLMRYYGVEYEYLFSPTLRIQSGKPLAYWRWFEENKKKQEELEKMQEMRVIESVLSKRPALFELVKTVLEVDAEQLKAVTNNLKEMLNT